MKKFIISLLITGVISTSAIANQNFNYKTSTSGYDTSQNSSNSFSLEKKTLKNSVVSVPAGQTFRCVFLSSITSENAYTGQEVTLALSSDFYYEDKKVAPVGSTVTGTVIEAAKAKHGSLNGKITLRFTHILTPGGLDIPISALVNTMDKSGAIIGGKDISLMTGDVSEISETSGASGYIPPFTGVHSGTNAAMSTAVETGGGGLLKSIWDKGSDVDIQVNSPIELILTQPITVNPTGN